MTPATDTEIASFAEAFARIEQEVARVLLGQEDVLRSVLVALFAGGHVLWRALPESERRCLRAHSPSPSGWTSTAFSSRPI